MSIGDGPDIEQFNRKEEEQIRFQNKVEKWWLDLEDNYKYELLEPYYPDDAYLMTTNSMWNSLEWNDKKEIWEEGNGYNEVVV